MITHEIKLLIGASSQGKKAVVKCHDTGISFFVKLETYRRGQWGDMSEPYLIPEGSTAIIKVAKPDNTYVVQSGEIKSGGILFKFDEEHTPFTVAGILKSEVSLYDKEGRRITSATFSIEVDNECVCDCEKESEMFIDVVGQQVTAANKAADRAEVAAERAEVAADRAEAAGGGGGSSWSEEDKEELEAYIDARIGEHTSDTANPHKVTARQVGATTEADVMLLIPQSEDVKGIHTDLRALQEQSERTKNDLEGIQQQINEEAHFRGYLSTNAKIQELEATPNDFAYSAESGTKWVYDAESGWQDTGAPVPDQLTPASEATPLADGVATPGTANEYARGDHRHPTDTTRVSVEEFNTLKYDIERALDEILAIQASYIGGEAE